MGTRLKQISGTKDRTLNKRSEVMNLIMTAREDFGHFGYSSKDESLAFWSHTPERDDRYSNLYFGKEILMEMVRKNILSQDRLWNGGGARNAKRSIAARSPLRKRAEDLPPRRSKRSRQG